MSLSDYMFRSVSNNGSSTNQPLTIKSIDRILKGIAKELNIPEGTVKSRLSKARKLLKEVLGRESDLQF